MGKVKVTKEEKKELIQKKYQHHPKINQITQYVTINYINSNTTDK